MALNSLVIGDLTLQFSEHNERAVVRWAMERFTEWLLTGVLFEINHDADPPWDSSGRLVSRCITDDDYQDVMQGTLAWWQDNYYAGTSTASYVSGCGLFYDDYRTIVDNYLRDTISSTLRSQVADEQQWWEIIENDEFGLFECALQCRIAEAIDGIPAKDAYAFCEKRVRQQLAQHEENARLQQAFVDDCRHRVIAFQNKFLPWLPVEYIDKNKWRDAAIESQLKKAVQYADTQTLNALATVGLMGCFSISVREAIEKILQKIYQKSIN